MFVSWDIRLDHLFPWTFKFSIASDSFTSPSYTKRRKVESFDSNIFSQVLSSKLSPVLHRLEVIATMGLSDFSYYMTAGFLPRFTYHSGPTLGRYITILIGQYEISLGCPVYLYVAIPTPNTIYVSLVETSLLKCKVVATYTAESSSLMFRAGYSLQDTLTLSSQSHAVL